MTEQQRATLEALKELKAEYMVGSLDAFRYIKMMRWYEWLLDSLAGGLGCEAAAANLSIMRVGWLADMLRDVVETWLGKTSVGISTSKTFSCVSRQKVVNAYDQALGLSSGAENSEVPGFFLWALDYRVALISFLQYVVQESVYMEEPEALISACEQWIDTGSGRELSFLIYERTGESVSPDQFASDVRYSALDPADIPGVAATEVDVLLSVADDHYEAMLLGIAVDSDDLEFIHEIIKPFSERQEASGRIDDLKRQWDADSTIADSNLNAIRPLLMRAGNEYTLGRIEVERRVALAASVFWREFGDPATAVGELIGHWRHLLQESTKRLRVFRSTLIPESVLRDEELLNSRHRYVVVALQLHKKWLIDFLSR